MSKTLLILAVSLTALVAQAQSTFNGNGNTSFGGPIGNGSLTLSDNGTTVSASLTTAASLGGNAFVLYIQAGAGGFSSTSGFNDNGDQLRTAISEYGGAGQQSTLNFGGGFAPNYAIALQPGAGINFGGLWSLANGGANSLGFVSNVGLTPTGSDAAGTYNFSFNFSSLGLGGGQSFKFIGIEVSTSGYSSAEAIGGSLSGANGWGNTQSVTSFSVYPVPEPSTLALCGLSGLAAYFLVRRRR